MSNVKITKKNYSCNKKKNIFSKVIDLYTNAEKVNLMLKFNLEYKKNV